MTAIIAGLGNPGSKYADTRHNIGFKLIDKIAKSLSVQLSLGKGPYYIGKGQYNSHKVLLVKPTTYMNISGDAVQHALSWYKLDTEQCLICYDDLAIETGSIRLRTKGSAGGHNGIKDIIQKLGTNEFPRLRIGIGDNFRPGQQVDYVLSKFSDKEQPLVDEALVKAEEAVFCFLDDGIDHAMNTFN